MAGVASSGEPFLNALRTTILASVREFGLLSAIDFFRPGKSVGKSLLAFATSLLVASECT